MTTPTTREEYNQIFLKTPHKWDNWSYDVDVYLTLRNHTEQPATVIDIGCGSGHTIDALHGPWRWTKYTGIELSNVAAEIARNKCPWANIYCSPLEEIELDDTFDVVLMLGVLEHTQEPEKILSKIHGFLSDNSLLYLEVPDCLFYSIGNEEGFRQTTIVVGGEGFLVGPQMEWHLKRETWEEMILSAGYVIEKYYQNDISSPRFIWILRRKDKE